MSRVQTYEIRSPELRDSVHVNSDGLVVARCAGERFMHETGVQPPDPAGSGAPATPRSIPGPLVTLEAVVLAPDRWDAP